MTEQATRKGGRGGWASWLLLAAVVSLPIMKPPVAYPIVLPDLLFLTCFAAFGLEVLTGSRSLIWRPAYWVLLTYVLSLAVSLLATEDLKLSVFKLATQVYLVGLAVVTCEVVQDRRLFRNTVLAWLAVTAVLAGVALLSLLAFMWSPNSSLYQYTRGHFGTLPPGPYPRLTLTFLNMNMLANYLNVSLGLLLVAVTSKWVARRVALLLGGAILVAAMFTISPGLGGFGLLLGVWLWAAQSSRLALAAGVSFALMFLLAAAVTPLLHPTAPFLIELPGLTLAPSGRYLTWSAAWKEFLQHPIIGHGIGIDAIYVRYLDPSGYLQTLTDAHNMFLNLAAQAGLAGVLGVSLLLGLALRLGGACGATHPTCFLLGTTFLIVFVYHGLSGSFEDTRHIWVLLGLLIAAARIDFSHADENSHKSAEPLPY